MTDDDGPLSEKSSRARDAAGAPEQLRARPLSDDPAVEAMGRLKGEEFKAIRDDPEHTKHAVAVQYERLLAERLRPTVEKLARLGASPGSQFADAVATALEPWQRVSARAVELGPKINAPDPRFIIPAINTLPLKVPQFNLPAFDVPDVGLGDQALARREILVPELPELEMLRDPTYDVVDGLEETNHRLGVLAENVGELVVQAQKDADDARADAEEARRSTRWSLIAAWAAVVVSVVLGVGSWLFNYVDQLEDRALDQVDERPAAPPPSTGPQGTPAEPTPGNTGTPAPARTP